MTPSISNAKRRLKPKLTSFFSVKEAMVWYALTVSRDASVLQLLELPLNLLLNQVNSPEVSQRRAIAYKLRQSMCFSDAKDCNVDIVGAGEMGMFVLICVYIDVCLSVSLAANRHVHICWVQEGISWKGTQFYKPSSIHTVFICPHSELSTPG